MIPQGREQGSVEYSNKPELWSSALMPGSSADGNQNLCESCWLCLSSTITMGEASYFDTLTATYQTIKHQTAEVCNADTTVGNSNLIG